jgi:hypothetical protein
MSVMIIANSRIILLGVAGLIGGSSLRAETEWLRERLVPERPPQQPLAASEE